MSIPVLHVRDKNGEFIPIKAIKGADGVSPTVNVSKADGVTTIEITDKNGVQTAIINDGQDATEKWELIELIEYNASNTPKEYDRQGLKLKGVYIKAIIPAIDEARNNNFIVYTDDGRTLYSYVSGATSTSDARVTHAYAELMRNGKRVMTTEVGTVSTTDGRDEAVTPKSITTFGDNDDIYINRVRYGHNSKNYPEGTVLECWGRFE